MMKIEVIGLEPPCKKCNELLENARNAVAALGIEAEVVKHPEPEEVLTSVAAKEERILGLIQEMQQLLTGGDLE